MSEKNFSLGGGKHFEHKKDNISPSSISFCELSHFEELYKYCLESTPVTAVQGYSPEGQIFFWNKASELLYGYSNNEVIGKDIKEILLPPEEWDTFNKIVQDIIQRGVPTEPQKWTVKVRTGDEKHVLSSMIPAKIKDTSYIFCMDVDVTELTNIQDRLRESEQKYRIIVESAHEGIWVVDEEFKTVFVNQKMADILGFSPEEMIGKPTLEFIPPDEYSDVQKQRAERLKGYMGQYERTLICADKSRRIFLVNASPIYDASNKFKGTIFLFSDITQRKEFENILRREHDRLQEFLNLSPSLFIVLDRDGNIQYLNNTAYATLKCNNSVIGKNWFSTFVAPSQKNNLQTHFEETMKEKTISDLEDIVHVINTKNEERVLILRHAFLYSDEGTISGLICSGMDITDKIQAEKERRAMEEKIRQTQRLESIGILAGGMAHDFNNLLVGIIGNADLALMEIPPDSSANYYLKEIIRISKELTHLSQQLLAYAGKGKTFVKPISLTALIKNIETLIILSVPKKVAVKFDLDENLPLINADPAHLQQLIINLILNAAEAIGDKSGVITIVTKYMYCDKKYWQTTYFGENCKEGTYIYLEIIDNGSGISKDVKDRM
ncbi:MAG: PAS domain-containing sensor histidine kinase, partial [Candidatus Hydrogenedens sp.]